MPWLFWRLIEMNGGKSRERRQCLRGAIIGYDRLWLDVIGSCDKSRLSFSCELSAWMKKMMALLTNYKVSKQLSCLDITALCHVKIKLEMVWKRDDCISFEWAFSNEIYILMSVTVFIELLWQWPENKLTIKWTAEHQFTNTKYW